MNGIDVSGWQAGIDISAVDADFVIVKATGGVSYVNPDFRRQADQALASGKLLGLYHFAGDGNAGSAEQEAAHFVDAVAGYIGRAVMVLDWEADATSWPIGWAESWLDLVASATDSTPWFYSYSSYINSTDCSSIARYPLWLAAYYAGYEPMGYQDDPPIYGGLGAWDSCVCYQYSSTGYVGGYNGRLDINKFYGDASDWAAFYKGAAPKRKKRGRKMECIIRPNGEDGLVYFDGVHAHPLTHPDEVTAIQEVYKRCTGEDIPIFEYGTPDAPWATRLFEACSREYK